MISIFKKKTPEEKDLPASGVAAETEAWSLGAADEGELMLDVIDAADKLIVRSTIAGADIGDIEVHVHNDLLTIRGKREDDLPDDSVFLYRECYFGPFSRSVILPHPVKEEAIEATLKNGVLTIVLPKKDTDATVKIKKE